MDISGLSLIRKLNVLELALDYAVRNKYLIFVNAFLIESEYDLFKDYQIVEKAIDYWKLVHPFLRCKIYTKYNEQHEPDAYEKFFFYVDEQEEAMAGKRLADVLYLDFHNDETEVMKHADYWKLLFEREFTIAVDVFYTHLWTLKIIRLNYDEATNKHNYCFLLNINHSIVDHVCTYAMINELCSYIDQAEKGTLATEVPDDLLKLYKYEFDYPNDIRDVKLLDEPFDTRGVKYGYKIPSFFLPTTQTHCGHIDAERDLDPDQLYGAFYLLDNSKYLSVRDIAEESKETYVTKYSFAKYPSEAYVKLCDRVREKNVNMTTCFALITALALKNVYRVFSDDTSRNDTIDYSLSVPLRSLLEPPIDSHVIGSWLSLLSFRLENEFDERNDEQFWTETFWQLAQKYSQDLEEKLRSDEKKQYFNNLAVLFNRIVKGLKCDGFVGHFLLNYVGDSVSRSNSSIYIKEHHKGLGFEKELTWSMYTNHDICCIDNTLYWDMTYSSYLMKREVAECWMDNISEIFYKIIK